MRKSKMSQYKTGEVSDNELRDATEMINFHQSIQVQTKIKGFTPLSDVVAKKYGITRAAVLGKALRFCRMKDGVCRASLSTIADGLGIDRSTAQRHLESLVDDGYLKDLTPDLKNKPHVYRNTGKLSFTLEMGVAECNVDGETVAERNATVAQSNVTVAQSHMSIESKIDSKKGKKGANPPAPTPPAILAYQNAMKRYPPKDLWESMAEAVGDNPEKVKAWEAHCIEWRMRGYKVVNYSGLFDSFKNGGLFNGNGRGRAQAIPYEKPTSEMTSEELQAEYIKYNTYA